MSYVIGGAGHDSGSQMKLLFATLQQLLRLITK